MSRGHAPMIMSRDLKNFDFVCCLHGRALALFLVVNPADFALVWILHGCASDSDHLVILTMPSYQIHLSWRCHFELIMHRTTSSVALRSVYAFSVSLSVFIQQDLYYLIIIC